MMKYIIKLIGLFTFVCVVLVSCSKDNALSSEIQKDLFQFNNQGGKDSVLVSANDNWTIEGVYSLKDNVIQGTLFGSIFKVKNGNYYRLEPGNQPLALDGIGKLEFSIADKGVTIERTSSGKLVFNVLPNRTYNDFNVAVVLKGADWQKTITLTQPEADHYTIDNIKYEIKSGDGESIYWTKTDLRTITVQSDKSTTMQAGDYPLLNTYKNSKFVSDDSNAFYWVSADNIPLVEVPHGLSSSNTLYFVNGEKAGYRTMDWAYDTFLDYNKKGEYTFQLSVGVHKYHFEIEMKQTKATYILTAKNSRTGGTITITGKWIGTVPTGAYKFVEE